MKMWSLRASCLLVLLISLFSPFVANQLVAADKYRFAASGMPDPIAFVYSGDLVSTGPERMLFMYAYSGVRLDAFELDRDGATGVSTTVFTTPGPGYIADYAAVWTGDKGLLFVLMIDNINPPRKYFVYVATFGADGGQIGKARRLCAVPYPSGDAMITAGWNGAEAQVVFAIYQSSPYVEYESPKPKRIAWTFAVDGNGRNRTAVTTLPLEYADDRTLDADFGQPVWNGARWLIAAWGVSYRIEYVPSKPSGNRYVAKSRNLAIFAVTGSASPQVRRIEIEEYSAADTAAPEIRSAQFIPASGAAPSGKAVALPLIVQTADYTPVEGDIEFYHSRWRLMEIGKTGTIIGTARELVLPAWKHRLPADSTFVSIEQIDELSPAVVAADGNAYLAHTRSLTRFRWTFGDDGHVIGREYRFDSQLDLYKVDSENGTLESVAQRRPTTGKQYLPTLLQPLGDSLAALNRAVTWGSEVGANQRKAATFLSVFPR